MCVQGRGGGGNGGQLVPPSSPSLLLLSCFCALSWEIRSASCRGLILLIFTELWLLGRMSYVFEANEVLFELFSFIAELFVHPIGEINSVAFYLLFFFSPRQHAFSSWFASLVFSPSIFGDYVTFDLSYCSDVYSVFFWESLNVLWALVN